LAALALLVLAPFAAVAQRLEISQARQLQGGETKVRVYADVQDSGGGSVGTLEMEDVAATLGQEAALVRGVRPFPDSQEGVGFIFLVDISLSMSDEQFGQIRAALDGWLSRLRPQDRAALVAFGSRSQVVVDWTDDLAELRAGLAALGPTDRETLLYAALFDALDLGDRRDPGLPGRRVVALLSDGRDEGSSQALDDVLAEIRRRPLPIYGIGYSQLQGAQRVTFLDVLRRIATNSGGAFFEAERTQFAQAYESIAEAVHRVWVVDLDCPNCIPDGRAARLQLSVRMGNRVLSKGTDVRLLPLASLPARGTPSTTTGPTSGSTSADPAGSPSVGGTPSEPSSTSAGGKAASIERPPQGEIERPGEDSAPAQEAQEAEPAAERSGGVRTSPLLMVGVAGLMVALIVVGLLARRAASSSEVTAEMVRNELSKALNSRAGETGSLSGVGRTKSSASGSLPGGLTSAESTPTPRGVSQAEMAAAGQAVQAEQVARAQQRDRLVERALLEGPPRPKVGAQALFVPRTLRLVTVRGEQKGKQYRAILREKLAVGARSTNDIVLTGESTAPPELLDLLQRDYRIQVRPAAQQIVLRNGLPPEPEDELRSGDLIGTRDLIFRLVLDD
jgi:Mg-chelatase subunit ChlD